MPHRGTRAHLRHPKRAPSAAAESAPSAAAERAPSTAPERAPSTTPEVRRLRHL